MTAGSRALGFASALALALLLAGRALAMGGTGSSVPAPDAPSGEAARHAALPVVCAPRQGSPAGAAAGFALAIAGSAALSRRRTDRLR
ncbi:MAG TPA: hypothetical protein DEP35_11300 [Deltaproteobacteria bacterium]|nr:hypothetical protein [Deltaproteobacteria bacterium]